MAAALSISSRLINHSSSSIPAFGYPCNYERVVKTRPHERRKFSAVRVTIQSFFESGVVQAEYGILQSDFGALLKVGRKYGKFDREGKILYLQGMKLLVERWQNFVKRMELVDDIEAKQAVNKLRTELGPLGLSSIDLADSMYLVLDEMKIDAERVIV